ncbi:unnamed protein product [Prorocentrum cordatum]|uniref:Transmembrane protein n=1 Tax=Prorocentrum cordatum TaxID=2364126 RepID=A0ABN9WF97_9DINO|nr:unnamed protein product [Polarella glacialis]
MALDGEGGAAESCGRLAAGAEASPGVGEAKPEAPPAPAENLEPSMQEVGPEAKPESTPLAEAEEAKPGVETAGPEGGAPAVATAPAPAGTTTAEADEATPEVKDAKPEAKETNADSKENARLDVISGVVGLRRRTLSTVVNSLSFTMGLAWLTFTKVVIVEDCCSEVTQNDAPQVWLCFVIELAILMPVSLLIIRRRLHLDRLSEEAYATGRMDDAEKLRARALVYQTMVSWAVGFTLAAQLSAAASASLPASPWEWKLFYALALLVLVVVLALVVFGIGICMGQDLRVLESISDVIVSGSAYTIALAFLDVVTAAFSLHSVSSTSDVDYLWEFYLVTCLVVALGTTVLGCLDYRGAREAAKELKQIEEAAQQGVVAIMKRSVVKHHLNANMRKLVSKTLSMCGVAVSFVLFHAWLLDWDTFDRNDGASSISSPFTFWGAMVFFLTCLFAAVVGSVLIEYNVNRMRKHLTKFDAMPSAVYDDWVMASLVVLLQTTSASLLEGMSWLVGTALHSWCLVGYTSIVRENDQADLLHKSAASLVFAMAVTMVTPLAMLRFAPPPLQGGSMQPHAK